MATLSLFVYDKPSTPTMMSVISEMIGGRRHPWQFSLENQDALIVRARCIAATKWLMNSPDDDVLVMCDDDFRFTGEGIDALVDLALEKKGCAAGVTPLKSGQYTAIVPLDFGPEEPWRDENCPPMEIRRAGGMLAFHRSVFEAMVTKGKMPLLHTNGRDGIEPFYPFFLPFIENHPTDGLILLSEDYACHERARELGFQVWVQPKCPVDHLSRNLLVTTKNMNLVLQAHRANVRKD